MLRELTVASAIHLAAVLPAVVIGVAQLLRRKGTRPHRVYGWIWVATMTVAAFSSFWITGMSRTGFSAIHLLSIAVLANLALAIWFARRGNLRAHRYFMLGTLAGLFLAGLGALAPGRFLGQLFL